jgi:uncharacterized protein YjdB
MNKKKLSAIILAFAIGSTLFMSKDYLVGRTNEVYAATINQNLSAITDIDFPKANSTNSKSIFVAGWALNKSGIKEVQILVDGQFKGDASIGASRPDVQRIFPAYGQANSGYSYTLDFSSIGSGKHNLTVKAIGKDGTSNSNTISINVNKPAPLLCIDTPHSGDATLNQTTINGWSLNASKVSSVDILVDGTKVGNAALGTARPDVKNAFPAYNDSTSGFTYTLDTSKLSHKVHTITVKSNGKDGSSAVQNITLNRPGNITTIDTPKTEQKVDGNSVNVAGWTLNPSGVKRIDIIMRGTTIGQAVLGDSRPDVAKAYPQYANSKSGYHFNLDTSNLSGGDYTITLKVTGNDGTTSINETSIRVDKPVSIMCLDTLSGIQNVLNSVPVNGWALNFSGLQQVEVLLDNNKVGNANIGVARPDVAKVYPQYNQTNSGFNYNLDTSKLSQGYHVVTVKAIGKDGTTTSQNYVISRPDAITDIDTPQSGLLNGNTTNIAGWALNASGIKQANILVDNKQVGTANIGDSRPDVAKVYPQYNNTKSGYHYTLNNSTVGGGKHTITVQAVGNDGSVKSSSVTVTRPDSLLNLDSPQQNQNFKNQNSVNVGGWALDITGVKQISVLVDNKQVGTTNTGVSRPDVNKFYPDYNTSNSGFNYNLDISKLTNGSHTITVNSTGNSGETVSATKTITVNNDTPSNPVINVSSISLNKTTDTLTVGNTDNLTATIAPTNAANKSVTWKSSNISVVAVDNTGKVTAVGAGTATITATTADGGKTANCTVTVNNKKGYVYNQELQIDLKVRLAPSLNGSVVGTLYNYQQIDILDTVVDSSGNKWDKFVYKNGTAYIADAYVSDAYIQRYTSPPDNVVNVASNITKTFEVKNSSQVTGNFDGTGLSLGYLQWCIGQDTLQPLLNRMDREHNAEMKSIFGANYTALHNMILDTPANQLKWAKSINDSSNNIIEPWHTQFTNLCNNQDFKNIESDAQVYTVKQAMLICDKYNLKTVRGFVLAFDIATQNGGITSDASKIIDAAVQKNPNITEKNLLGVIANAVADTSTINKDDVRARELAIVNGKGTVHGSTLNLDANYGLSDTSWR